VDVARWDDDSDQAQRANKILKVETKNPYKPQDKHDQEYDMGRLKKMKTKKEEDQWTSSARNPFQEWAN
jgi:hypothetical protein